MESLLERMGFEFDTGSGEAIKYWFAVLNRGAAYHFHIAETFNGQLLLLTATAWRSS